MPLLPIRRFCGSLCWLSTFSAYAYAYAFADYVVSGGDFRYMWLKIITCCFNEWCRVFWELYKLNTYVSAVICRYVYIFKRKLIFVTHIFAGDVEKSSFFTVIR